MSIQGLDDEVGLVDVYAANIQFYLKPLGETPLLQEDQFRVQTLDAKLFIPGNAIEIKCPTYDLLQFAHSDKPPNSIVDIYLGRNAAYFVSLKGGQPTLTNQPNYIPSPETDIYHRQMAIHAYNLTHQLIETAIRPTIDFLRELQ